MLVLTVLWGYTVPDWHTAFVQTPGFDHHRTFPPATDPLSAILIVLPILANDAHLRPAMSEDNGGIAVPTARILDLPVHLHIVMEGARRGI